MRKFVHALIVRRGPESADAFTAMQLNRLNEALRTSYGAMWETNLATVDRAVGIVRELGRRHGLGGGASGTEPCRKPLATLDSGAGMAPVGSFPAKENGGVPATETDAIPDWRFLADLAPRAQENGTEWRRKPLETLDSGAGMAPIGSSLAGEDRGEAEDGTERRRNLLKSLVSGAGMAPVGSSLDEEDGASRRRRPPCPRIGVPCRPLPAGRGGRK